MSTVTNRVAVMHGVNLDTLGRRDPAIYGSETLNQLEARVHDFARELDLEASFFQTNHEGEFCEYLHRVRETADAVLINAGAWSHYSWAIRDALEVAAKPAVEVHISDVDRRGEAEPWRSISVFDGLVLTKISGKGVDGYREALEVLKGELGA
ncbi:MAG: 3-dehydroquinate dehydratase [Solirubrobacterales bacterium]|nr:3-dehydroquinate dehydratase [Solirubrobacterales bacterium]